MHLFRATQNNPQRSVLTYSAFHALREGVRSFKADQAVALICALSIDFALFLAALFAWCMCPPIAILGTLPFALFTWAIFSRILPKRRA